MLSALVVEEAKTRVARNLLSARGPCKSHWSGPEGGEMGVAGEKGSGEVFRCVGGRCFGKKNPRSAPVNS
jgi:hypothetical protein